MSDHDPFCYQFVEHAGMPSDCFCDLIASVCAGERASAYPGREIRSQLLEALQKVDALNDQLAVARAEVAAHEDAASNMLTAWRNTRAERDAARAEVAALRDQLDIAIDERHHADMRAALRLRAKAEGLGHWIDCEAFENLNEGSDYGNENIRETGEPCSCLIGEFLALLDEKADRG